MIIDSSELFNKIKEETTIVLNSAYGTDDRHEMLAGHIAAKVVDGVPIPWDLAKHFGRMPI